MKIGTNVLSLALLALISMWAFSGCTKYEPSTTATIDTPSKEPGKGEEDAKHAGAKTTGHKAEAQAKHDDHKNHGHKRGEDKDHGAGAHQDMAHPQGKVKVGDIVPDFSLRTLDGKSVKLSELQNDETRTKKRIVVLSFWCSTCHSCRDVEHLLSKLHKDYAGQAAIMALDANANETAKDVAAFLKKNGLELPMILDTSGDTADLFGVKRTTTTVVIDGNGVLRYLGQFRQQDSGSAEEALKAVMAGKEVNIKTTPHNG